MFAVTCEGECVFVTGAQELVKKTVSSCDDALIKKQLGYLLARQGVALNLEDTAGASMDEDLQMELQEIISNSKLSELYLSLARDLDVMEAKLPEEVRDVECIDRAPVRRTRTH